MQRITHNLVQGSIEWKNFRKNHNGSSETSAMLGISPYKTRDNLLYEKATGITQEVSPSTQKVFDRGHEVEKLALPIVEKIINVDLSPVVMSFGKLSTSTDGLDFAGEIAWENKQFNKAHFEQVKNGELPEIHWPQCQQSLYVTGAQKLFFTISDGTKENTVGVWVYPDKEKINRIIDGWALFQKDLANYQAKEVKEVVVADVVEALPAPSIVAKGSLVASNLDAITPQFDTYLAETPRSGFKTELDFANAEANGKNARKMAKTLNDTCEAVIAQQSDINQAITVMRKYAKDFNTLGLALENAVAAEKEAIKNNAILAAKNKYAEHVSKLQAEITGVTLHHKLVCPDFQTAVKGVRKLESLHANINEALNAGILDAEALARDVRTKLAYLDEAIKGYEGLFADKQSFIFGEFEYIKLLVTTRIDAQKTKDAEREAQIKARAEAEALAKIEQEKKDGLVKKQALNPAQVTLDNQTKLPPQLEAEFGKHFGEPIETIAPGVTTPKTKPSDADFVAVVATYYGVSEAQAEQWLIDSFGLKQAA